MSRVRLQHWAMNFIYWISLYFPALTPSPASLTSYIEVFERATIKMLRLFLSAFDRIHVCLAYITVGIPECTRRIKLTHRGIIATLPTMRIDLVAKIPRYLQVKLQLDADK